jgi:hypothetical protein
MKQNINVEQMKEVKDTVLAEALNDLEFKEGLGTLNILLPEDYRERDIWLHNMASRVTISKMIEIIDKKTEHHFIIDACLLKGNNYKNLGEGYGVSLRGKYHNKNFNYKELCDALWEAVKYVLEEDS